VKLGSALSRAHARCGIIVGAPNRAHALRMGPGPPRSNIVGRQIALRLVHGCLIADFTASRLGGGGPAARTAHARACTTKHAARHRFAGWCGISGRQRSHRFRCDVLQAVHSQLRCLRRAAAGGQPARRRRCGRAGRGASLLAAAAALGEEVRALSQRGDGEARGALGRAGRGASFLPAVAALGEEVHALSQCGDGEARGALVALVARVAQR